MHRKIFVSLVSLWMTIGIELPTYAQSIIAAPDGTGTTIHTNGNQINIQGGTQAGSNLFHSFQQFNLNTNQIANFLATPTIQNILSRVVGGSPSYIDGLIRVSGSSANLYLMNPAGIVFGANASLNVPASFTATTAHAIGFGCRALTCDGWFATTGNPTVANLGGQPGGLAFLTQQSGAIVNAGHLAVPVGQTLTLAGGTIVNTGTLTAPGGQVNILAVPGERFVRIQETGNLLSFDLPLDTQSTLTATAQPLTAPALPQLLTGGNLTSATGVTVENGIVTLTRSATPIATTPGSLTLAGQIFVDAATATGNGGRVIAIGENTVFAGTISAQGGSLSGNGGFVETSGKQTLTIDPTAIVDTRAANGTIGTWLLDPATLTVVAAGGTGSITGGVNTNADSTINASTIVAALNGSNVTLQADSLITIDAIINASGNSNIGSLTLQAPTIVLNQPIQLKSGARLNGTASTVAVGTAGSIQNAVDVAQSGANIFLAAAAYSLPDAISINKTLTIRGAGTTSTIVSSTGFSRVFEINAGNVTLENFTIANGTALFGGGIFNDGNLTLRNITLTQNTALVSGGAIYNTGKLTIETSNLFNNQAFFNGGAIFNAGVARIENSLLSSNPAFFSGSIANRSDLTISNSVIDGKVTNLPEPPVIVSPPLAIEPPAVTLPPGNNSPLPTGSLPPAPLRTIQTVLSGQVESAAMNSSIQPTIANSTPNQDKLSELSPILTVQSEQGVAQTIAATDSSFSQAYDQYLGLTRSTPIDVQQLQFILTQIQQRRVRSGLIYVSFVPKNRSRTSPSSNPQSDDQLQLILLRATGQPIIRQVAVTRAEVIQQASLFRAAVSDPEDDQTYIPLAQQLYGWLVAPLEADLQAEEMTNLVFCLDEGLRTIPLAAMMYRQQFVIERYAVSIVPSAALTNLAVTPPKTDKILAMGAAQFSSKEALPAVPLELTRVSKVINHQAIVLNDQFTRSNLLNLPTQSRPEILHLATHAQFNPGDAQQSYIQLWDSQLTLKQMRSLNWKDLNLTLLTLSACTTAVGSREAELGFAGLAAVSGVRTALGSLWTVSDVGTLALMSEFYSNFSRSLTLTEALQKAQLALMKGTVQVRGDRLITNHDSIILPNSLKLPKDLRFTHPFYWSSFTLVGNPW